MSTTVTPPAETTQEEPKLDIAKFFKERNERESAVRAGKEPPKVEAAEPEKPVEKPEDKPVRSDKPSGDMRRLLKLARENGELRSRLEAIEKGQKPEEKPVVQENAEPKRPDFATDDEYRDARAAFTAKQTTEKALKDRDAEQAQAAEIQRVATQFETQMKNAADPEKGGWADWPELLKTSKAATVDIYAEAPELFGALISSKWAKEVMYEFLKQPERLNMLIDTFKTNKREGIEEFQALVGEVRVLHKAKPKEEKPEPKPEVKAAEDKPKPRPTATVRAPAGEGVPEEPAPGSKAWMDKRNAGIKSRGW